MIRYDQAMPVPYPSDLARWFAQEVQPHEAELRAWLRSRYSAIRDTDDLVQDAFMRVLQAHQRSELHSAKAFLFATARNLALDQLRHQQVIRLEPLVETGEISVLEEGNGVPETVTINQELALLTEAIQSLPDRCRQIFTLRKVYGLSQKEIAARLAISEHTVSAQLTIGFHKCVEYVEARMKGDRTGR